MARGIISTILGGVAGGLEGLGVQQERRRLEEQRRREALEDTRWREAQLLNLQTQGFRSRPALEAALGGRTTPEQRVQQTPDFGAPGGPRIDMSPVRGALSAAEAERMSGIDRGFQVSLGDEEFVLPYEMTPQGIREADRLQAIEDLKEGRQFTREELVRENRGVYNLMKQQGYDVGEFDPDAPYASYYDVVSRERIAAAGRAPTRPELSRLEDLQNAYLNAVSKLHDGMGGFDQAAADWLATKYGNIMGMTGPQFQGLLGDIEPPPPPPVDPDSGVSQEVLDLVRGPEERERERRERAEQLQVNIDFLERQLANPDLPRRQRNNLETNLNRLRGDLRELQGLPRTDRTWGYGTLLTEPTLPLNIPNQRR
jgi:hypothetical protein